MGADIHVEALERALLDLNEMAAERVLRDAGQGSLKAETLESVLVPALIRIGDAWEHGDVALSQVYMSGRMSEHLVDSLDFADVRPRVDQPRIAIGVLEDAHVLGKQIVLQMLRSAGYEVKDLGARLSVNNMADAVLAHDVEVLLISVLMLRSALQVSTLRERLAQHGCSPTIVVGGAPFRFDAALAGEVGADFTGTSAADILSILTKIELARL